MLELLQEECVGFAVSGIALWASPQVECCGQCVVTPLEVQGFGQVVRVCSCGCHTSLYVCNSVLVWELPVSR